MPAPQLFEKGAGIVVDSSDDSYVTGSFVGTATFGPGEINETILTSDGSNEIFVAKYDSNGALHWATRAGGSSIDEGVSIAVDGSNSSYVTGRFSRTATFGSAEVNETMLTSDSTKSSNTFVAKYLNDSDGDGIPDVEDNCPTVFNPDQFDTDGDNIGNVCDDELLSTVKGDSGHALLRKCWQRWGYSNFLRTLRHR